MHNHDGVVQLQTRCPTSKIGHRKKKTRTKKQKHVTQNTKKHVLVCIMYATPNVALFAFSSRGMHIFYALADVSTSNRLYSRVTQ